MSLDILPELKELWPKKGDQLYIRLEVDKKDRIWGFLAYQEDFQRLARPAYNNMQNQNWPAIVYRLKLSGYLCLSARKITCLALSILASAMRSHV